MSVTTTVSFNQTLKDHELELERTPLEILQINVGKVCNQACLHCHVEAGPKRTESMGRVTFERLIDLLKNQGSIHTVDITGGAPELNPNFRWFVEQASGMGLKIIDRCNLTVLFEPGQEDLAAFLAKHKVEVVASMPCYSKDNVDKQRGRGVFDKSVRALQALNDLGYGKPGTGLTLSLVYNPVGAFLPPAQEKLESDYKRELRELFDIEFNQLFTITNMPIKRFLDYLQKTDKLEEYMDSLLQNFNPGAARGVMCRNLISIGWEGDLFDCDFNQMLEIPASWKQQTIWDVETLQDIDHQNIAFADHCYGCTAGSGSSCGGALV